MGNYLDGYAKETCGHCGLKRTPEGHDGCIGTLPNIMNACCGHGENRHAYVQFWNTECIRGEEALKHINEHKISDLKKNAAGNDIRIVDGKEIIQIEEKTQADIDLNCRINLWRMRKPNL
jgi:hypothetical protein